MTDPTRRPTAVNASIAGGCALLVVAVCAVASVSAVAVAAGGGLVLVLGLVRGVDEAVDVGCLGLFGGVLAGALAGGSVELTLVGTVATVVAWDLGRSALDLGEQLGREADTARLEAVHAGSSALVGLVTVTAGYGLYALAADGQPVWAVALLLAAAALVTVGLRVRSRGRTGSRRRGRARP